MDYLGAALLDICLVEADLTARLWHQKFQSAHCLQSRKPSGLVLLLIGARFKSLLTLCFTHVPQADITSVSIDAEYNHLLVTRPLCDRILLLVHRSGRSAQFAKSPTNARIFCFKLPLYMMLVLLKVSSHPKTFVPQHHGLGLSFQLQLDMYIDLTHSFLLVDKWLQS